MEKLKKIFKMDMVSSAGNSFPNWVRLLFRHRFRINFKYIPRAITVTLATFFLYPFVILEKVLFDRKIKKTKVVSPVFIMGHMRSGTTFLHYLLSQDKRFCYTSTSETIFPWIFLTLEKIIRAFMRTVLPDKRPMDNMGFKEEYPQEEEFAIANLCPYSPQIGAYFPKSLEDYYRKYSLFENVKPKVVVTWRKAYIYFLQKITLKNNGKRVLSKSLVNSSRIRELIKMFPDAKFISIHRNPYHLFLSTKKLYKKFIFKNFSFQDISDEELEQKIITLAKIGYERYLEDKKLLNKNNLVEIQYEKFVKSPLKYIKEIYRTFKIDGYKKIEPHFKALLDDYKNYKADNYIIDNKLKNRIYKELKIIFDNFGYSKII